MAGCKGSAPASEEPGGVAPKVAGEKSNPGTKANSPGVVTREAEVGEEESPVMMCYETVPNEPEGAARDARFGKEESPPEMMCYDTVPIEGEKPGVVSGVEASGDDRGRRARQEELLKKAFVSDKGVAEGGLATPEAAPVTVPTEADAESIDIRESPPADEEKPPPPRMCYKTVHLEIDG